MARCDVMRCDETDGPVVGNVTILTGPLVIPSWKGTGGTTWLVGSGVVEMAGMDVTGVSGILTSTGSVTWSCASLTPTSGGNTVLYLNGITIDAGYSVSASGSGGTSGFLLSGTGLTVNGVLTVVTTSGTRTWSVPISGTGSFYTHGGTKFSGSVTIGVDYCAYLSLHAGFRRAD